MSDIYVNGNGNGNGTMPPPPAAPAPAEQPINIDAVLGYLMDGMERLTAIAQPAPIDLTAEQRTRLANLFIVRYAIESGVPVQAALEIGGFDIDIAAQAPPPQTPPPAPPNGNTTDNNSDDISADMDNETAEGDEDISADTRALRDIFESVRALLLEQEHDEHDAVAAASEAGAELDAVDGEAENGDDEANAEADDPDASNAAREHTAPASAQRGNAQRGNAQRRRGRRVR